MAGEVETAGVCQRSNRVAAQEAQQVLNLDLFQRNHLEQHHLDRPSQLVGDQAILLAPEILLGVTEDRTE